MFYSLQYRSFTFGEATDSKQNHENAYIIGRFEQSKLKFIHRNAGKFNLETKQLLISALIQCNFDYTCSAWYNGLSKKMKCRMQCTHNKIIKIDVKCSMEVPCSSQ